MPRRASSDLSCLESWQTICDACCLSAGARRDQSCGLVSNGPRANSEMKDRQVGSHEQTRTEQSYNYLSICQNEFGYIEHGIVPQSIVAPVHLLQNIETLLRTPMCLDRTESHAP